MYHIPKGIDVNIFENPQFVKSDHFVPLVVETLKIFKGILDKANQPYEVLNYNELMQRHKNESDRSINYYVYLFQNSFLLTRYNVVEMFCKPLSRLTIHATPLSQLPNDHFKSCPTDQINMKLNKNNLEESWELFNGKLDIFDDACTIAKIKLQGIFDYMADFFDYMVVWGTKNRVDTFIKYFIRGKPINDFNRAFLIVEPSIIMNVIKFMAKTIRENELYADVGYTFSITDKDSWKSVQMVIYIYQFPSLERTNPIAGYPFELQILTPQVLAYEHFQSTHVLYEIARLPDFNDEWIPVWKFLLEKGIHSPDVKKFLEEKCNIKQ